MATFPLPPNQNDPQSPVPEPGIPAGPAIIPPPPADFSLDGDVPAPAPQPPLTPALKAAPADPTPVLNTAPVPTPGAQPSFAPPPITPDAAPPQPAEVAPVKKSPFRWIAPIAIAVIVLGIIAFIVIRFVLPSSGSPSSSTGSTAPDKATTITYYGLWEPPEVMGVVLKEFESQNPGIKVDYQLQQSTDYRERLQTLLSGKSTPDVVRFHSTWIPMLLPSLQPAPATAISATEISSNFYPAVSDAVISGNQVYGVPTTLDGLGLYVNQQIFDTTQAQVPKTWEDLRSTAKTLTQYDPNTGQISQAGAALGTTSNVDHWPDIVSLMLLQNNVDITTMAPTNRVSEALKFYTLFNTSDKVWNENLPSSVQAFAAGNVAMIMAPSWQALTIQELNPSLSWKIYPVPQLPNSPPVTWVNFWVEGVPKNASNPEEAWKLVKYLSSSQAQQLLFDTATKQRGFGQAPANKALASSVSNNPIIGPYVSQASTAETFYTTSFTHDGDTGINSRLIKYLGDAVNGYNQGLHQDQVISTLQQGFYQVLSQYNIVAPTPAPVK